MIGWLTAAWAAPVVVDRVDVVSEPNATWLAYDLPHAADAPDLVVIRFVEQIAPVVAWGDARLSLSLASQTLAVERRVGPEPCGVQAGLVTRLGLPVGGLVGISARPGPVRVGASVVLLSGATWSRADWTTWTVLPGLGLGFGRDLRPRAPWMGTGD